MTGRIGLIATGVLGVIILIGLSVWQFQRLSWKEGIIATLEARLAADPIALPTTFDPKTQEFSRVRIAGQFTGERGSHGFADAPLLTSMRPHGPGYRIIQPFDMTDGRRVMVTRGFVPVAQKNEGGAAARPTPVPKGEMEIIGALRWPDERGDGQPFGSRDNVWTNRNLAVMADLFGTEEVLIVAETSTAVDDWPIPQPIEAVNVTNNHLEYALTWATLALAWAAMTGWLVFRPQKSSS
ncbi:MAG: SURF1 family protein [Pseudomonadota bacterium]